MTVNITVVMAHSGCYSDSWSRPIKAFYSQAEAKQYIQKLEFADHLLDKLVNIGSELINYSAYIDDKTQMAYAAIGEEPALSPTYKEDINEYYENLDHFIAPYINEWVNTAIDRIKLYNTTSDNKFTDEEIQFLETLQKNDPKEFYNIITAEEGSDCHYSTTDIDLICLP